MKPKLVLFGEVSLHRARRRKNSTTQQVGELAGIDSIIVVAGLQERVFADRKPPPWRRVVSRGRTARSALVPSSKVTHSVPRTAWMNSRIVDALVSITESITTLPPITAIETVA
jgi:hypothetical protein